MQFGESTQEVVERKLIESECFNQNVACRVGHNGREETTTFCLIPAVREATTLPLIAAGGIGTGEGILAAMVLGAEGVQIGTRFALTEESSASPVFKEYCLSLGEGDTKLLLKKLAPTRLVKNGNVDHHSWFPLALYPIVHFLRFDAVMSGKRKPRDRKSTRLNSSH